MSSSQNSRVWCLVALACALSISALASSADAYCRSTSCSGECGRDVDDCKTQGAPLYWPGYCVSFSLHKDGSEHIEFAELQRVAAESFVAWSELDCGDGLATLAFQQRKNVDCHKAEYNVDGANANIVLFQDHKWSYKGVDNTLAKTTVTYDTDTGEILDADIELNHAYNEYTTGDDYVVYDLQSILTHEIGHFVGLDHTFDLIATMNAGYQEGTTELRSLESDDIDGICAIFPPSRDVQCNPEPNGGFASECGAEATVDDGGICSVAPVLEGSDGERFSFGWLGLIAVVAGVSVVRRLRSV